MKRSYDDNATSSFSRRQVRRALRVPIERLIEASATSDGVDTRELREGDVLVICTAHSRYRMLLRDPANGSGTVVGDGNFLQHETEARLVGASLSGRHSMLRIGWVLLDRKVVLSVDGGELLTSRVCGLELNGVSLLSRPHQASVH